MPSTRSTAQRKSRPFKNAVGPAVRRLRNERGWTQLDFAAKLQVLGWNRCTRSWLSRVEAQVVAVRDYELAYFCKALRTPLSELFPSFEPQEIDPGFQ